MGRGTIIAILLALFDNPNVGVLRKAYTATEEGTLGVVVADLGGVVSCFVVIVVGREIEGAFEDAFPWGL